VTSQKPVLQSCKCGEMFLKVRKPISKPDRSLVLALICRKGVRLYWKKKLFYWDFSHTWISYVWYCKNFYCLKHFFIKFYSMQKVWGSRLDAQNYRKPRTMFWNVQCLNLDRRLFCNSPNIRYQSKQQYFLKDSTSFCVLLPVCVVYYVYSSSNRYFCAV